jgi:hypothetical protein
MRSRKDRFRAAASLVRGMFSNAVLALAGNPPQLSIIIASAALGLLLDLLPSRPGWMLRME